MGESNQSRISCQRCQLPLARAKTRLTYQGVKFEGELLRCPKCGQAFVPEDLALGKLHEVEITLEDK